MQRMRMKMPAKKSARCGVNLCSKEIEIPMEKTFELTPEESFDVC